MSTPSPWSQLDQLHETLEESRFPRVTIVVPTFNSAQRIGITMESLINQNYSDFEILLIDAGSTDRTVEIVKSYRDRKIRFCAVTGFNRYEMLNKGISLSRGEYINFMFPGDYYIHHDTLRTIMSVAARNNEPELVYCGCLLREANREVKILFRELSLQLLKGGQQPTSLQSCWFKIESFRAIGKFNPNYTLRGGFDLLCRFVLSERLTWASTNRVLTDYDLRGVTRKMVVRHFYETLRILVKHFGVVTAGGWLLRQTEVQRYCRLWWRSFRVAVLGGEK